MAKEGGMADQFAIGGYDLSTDVSALDSIASRRAALDVTSISVAAVERISGLRDGEMNFTSWFDNAATFMGDALETLPLTDRIALYLHGATVGAPCAGIIGKQINYDPTHGADGSLSVKVQIIGNGFGVEWGDQLTTGKQTFASATNGTSIDYTAASTTFGAVGYLQVFSVASGTATVAIQDSADNAAFADITGLIFTGATARTEQRLATAAGATIRRYVRVNLTGGFTTAVVAVLFRKFEVAQS